MFWQGGAKKRLKQMMASRLEPIHQNLQISNIKIGRTDQQLLKIYYHRQQISLQNRTNNSLINSRVEEQGTFSYLHPKEEQIIDLKQNKVGFCLQRQKQRDSFNFQKSIRQSRMVNRQIDNKNLLFDVGRKLSHSFCEDSSKKEEEFENDAQGRRNWKGDDKDETQQYPNFSNA